MFYIKNFFSFEETETRWFLFLLGFKISHYKKIKAVVFTDAGGIGDYILTRPYFKYLRTEKFANYKLIYLTKNSYKTFTKIYDNLYFDKIIPYDNISIKDLKEKLKKFEIYYLINLFALSDDKNYQMWIKRNNVVKSLKAKFKITDIIVRKKFIPNSNLNIYNQLISTSAKHFELDSRKLFFEMLMSIDIEQQTSKITPVCDFSKPYIIISLFTGVNERNYIKNYWIQIINYIVKKTNNNVQILFIGTSKDYQRTNDILKNILDPLKQCKNICGLFDITLAPAIIKNALFLLSPDTGTVHIANSVNTPVICISSGYFYKRFIPYANGVTYVFPDELDKLIKNKNDKELSKLYNNQPSFGMNDIRPEKIIKIIEKYLKSLDLLKK